jgi:malonate transporter and related proteins
MGILLDVVLPVFLVIGLGWLLARRGKFGEKAVDALMEFSQGIAVPCLLFRQMAHMDLGQSFSIGLVTSFYAGAFICFGLALLVAWKWLGRPLDESVATGFAAMFSNTLLLGLSITERAYGSDALAGNYAIIALHSPLFYGFGITFMELVRHHGHGLSAATLARKVLRAIFTQPLVLGITLGFAVNVSHLPLPGALDAATEMLGRAGLPTALFGLGGVLHRYKIEGDRMVVALIVGLALVVHPVVTYGLGLLFQLDVHALRSAVVTAAMPPGANAYLFAHMYAVGRRANASAVLFGTGLAILTAWFWLQVLP